MEGPAGLVVIRVYGSLGDFLPRGARGREVCFNTDGRAPVRHLAGAVGIPHPEIGAVLLGGSFAGLDAVPRAGDRLALYPSLPDGLPEECALRPPLPRPPSFVLDPGLGRLARILRLLGFEAEYRPGSGPERLVESATSTGSVLLSRDRRLLMRRAVVHGCCIRSNAPRAQAAEVMARFDLAPLVRMFHFCSRCGGEIERVSRSLIDHLLEPLTRLHYDEFWRCGGCGRIYWAGSHLPALEAFLERIAAHGRGGMTGSSSTV